MSKKLINFPCIFFIKVVGFNSIELREEVSDILNKHNFIFDNVLLKESKSNNDKYLGLTLKLYINNQIELDNIYFDLTKGSLIKFVL